MTDGELLDAFMDGFAKTAEDAGFAGEQVRGLLELAVGLAQRVNHPDAFDAGFKSVVGG